MAEDAKRHEDSGVHAHDTILSQRFQQVFEAEFDYVARSLRRLGVRPSDVEDMTQEVFSAVHTHFDKYDPSRAIRPWLFAFAARVASNYRRLKRHQHEMLGVPIEPASANPDAETDALKKQDRELVLAALDALDFDRRQLVIMHDVDGMTVPEIAEALKIPVNTAYSRLRVARQQFVSNARRIQAVRGAS